MHTFLSLITHKLLDISFDKIFINFHNFTIIVVQYTYVHAKTKVIMC